MCVWKERAVKATHTAKDGDKGVAGVGVAAEGHVAESNILKKGKGEKGQPASGEDGSSLRKTYVVDGDVAGSRLGEFGLAGEGDVVHDLEGEGEVAEEDMNAEQADDGEVSEVPVKGLGAVFSGNLTERRKGQSGTRVED